METKLGLITIKTIEITNIKTRKINLFLFLSLDMYEFLYSITTLEISITTDKNIILIQSTSTK